MRRRAPRLSVRFGLSWLRRTGDSNVPKAPLRTEIAALLGLKLVALTLLYFLFFAPSGRPHADARATASHIVEADDGRR
jgi:hypothetical protein